MIEKERERGGRQTDRQTTNIPIESKGFNKKREIESERDRHEDDRGDRGKREREREREMRDKQGKNEDHFEAYMDFLHTPIFNKYLFFNLQSQTTYSSYII